MSEVRDFFLIVVKKGSIVSVVSEEKQQRSERSQIFPFNSGESKTVFEHSQRFSFKSS